ncbi:hypothetical protein BSKO_09584 [Bryopsis sp. KO-2023]|nr:hypothetical protein BSKO_09584 [Bryopsis sp. KO-2023]
MRRREAAPKTETCPISSVRDAYGFEVKREFQHLYNRYSPLWEKEENERGERWKSFLSLVAPDIKIRVHGEGHWIFEDRSGAERGLGSILKGIVGGEACEGEKCHALDVREEWHQHFRALVQAGIPMSRKVKGLYWLLAKSPQKRSGSSTDDEIGKGASSAPAQEKEQKVDNNEDSDWITQIEKDLHRTFPGHPLMDITGRDGLRRVLAAYSRYKPDVGYCQGMNFTAGLLLLFMDEEEAFWCLSALVEDLLPGHFHMEMIAPVIDQMVFRHMVEQHFPKLAAHLQGLGVDIAYMCTQWFLCCFVNALPLESCLRVWDLLFFERCPCVMFRVALALVDVYSQALVQTVDALDAWELLQSMAPMSYDSSQLIDVACIAFSNVTQQYLDSLRDIYNERFAKQDGGNGGQNAPDPCDARTTDDQVPGAVASSPGASPIAAYWALREVRLESTSWCSRSPNLGVLLRSTFNNVSTSSAAVRALEIAATSYTPRDPTGQSSALWRSQRSLAGSPENSERRSSDDISSVLSEEGAIRRAVEDAVIYLQGCQTDGSTSSSALFSEDASAGGSVSSSDLGLKRLFDGEDPREGSRPDAFQSTIDGGGSEGHSTQVGKLVQLVVSLQSKIVRSERRRLEAQQKATSLSETVSALRNRIVTILEDAKHKEEFTNSLIGKMQKLIEELERKEESIDEQRHIIMVQQDQLVERSKEGAGGRTASAANTKTSPLGRLKEVLKRDSRRG